MEPQAIVSSGIDHHVRRRENRRSAVFLGGFLVLSLALEAMRPGFFFWNVETASGFLYLAIFMFAYTLKDYSEDGSSLLPGVGFLFAFVLELAYLYNCVAEKATDCRLAPSGYFLWTSSQWFHALGFLLLAVRDRSAKILKLVFAACLALALVALGLQILKPWPGIFFRPSFSRPYLWANALGFIAFYAFIVVLFLRGRKGHAPFLLFRSLVSSVASLLSVLGILAGLGSEPVLGQALYYLRFLAIFLCYNAYVTLTLLSPYRYLYGRLVARADELSRLNADLEGSLEEKEALIEEKSALLAQKEALLGEVHHRVKNNLQIATSILSLQASYSGDPALGLALEESQNRLRAMAAVHELLYREHDFGSIDFARYLERVTGDLFHSSGRGEIKRILWCESVVVPLELAVPLGLIVNEVVTNCLKHAFPPEREGRVTIRLEAKDGLAHLIVEDDGVGLPPDFDFAASGGLGFSLIRGLATQVGARLEVVSGKGTRFTLDVPHQSSRRG